LILEVSRDNLIEDTLHQLTYQENKTKMQLKVHFRGEEGIDEGGLTKEFFSLIIKELFDPSYYMFLYFDS
jgi:hypothetical protein